MAAIPDIPEQFSWAWEEDVLSSHRAVPAAGIRYSTPHYFLAICLACLSAIGFFVPAKEGIVVSYTIGILCLLGTLALGAWGVVRGTSLIRLVDVYASGVLWLGRDDWRGARWEEIDEVLRAEIYMNGSVQTRVVSVKTALGEKADFQYILRDWQKLADAVLMQTTRSLLPRALERYGAGESLPFGPVSISKEGLEFAKTRCHFTEITQIRIGNGNVVVFVSGSKVPQTIAFSSLPNYLVFLKLLETSPAPRPVLQ